MSPSEIVRRSRQSIWPVVSVEEAMSIIEEHAFLTDKTRTILITDIKIGILSTNLNYSKSVNYSVKDNGNIRVCMSACFIATIGQVFPSPM